MTYSTEDGATIGAELDRADRTPAVDLRLLKFSLEKLEIRSGQDAIPVRS
jgi:hypothetical protein